MLDTFDPFIPAGFFAGASHANIDIMLHRKAWDTSNATFVNKIKGILPANRGGLLWLADQVLTKH
jgi:hypothetical protein